RQPEPGFRLASDGEGMGAASGIHTAKRTRSRGHEVGGKDELPDGEEMIERISGRVYEVLVEGGGEGVEARRRFVAPSRSGCSVPGNAGESLAPQAVGARGVRRFRHPERALAGRRRWAAPPGPAARGHPAPGAEEPRAPGRERAALEDDPRALASD